jgi:hypothetical protein
MRNKQTSSETGQVLVLLVLVIVGLLAFTALAVDGGMLFADRRGAQNASDAAVLAGGYRIANTLDDFNLGFSINYGAWDCGNVQAVIEIAEGEAYIQASTNGYPVVGESSLLMECSTEDFGSYEDRYVDTTVEIISEVETSFIHFAYGGPMENTVTAISRVRPRMPLAFGYAIYAHRDDCPNSNTGGVRFDGGNQVTVQGGGIMSDACIVASGSSVRVNVSGGEINHITGWDPNGAPVVIPTPTQQVHRLPDWALLFPEPDCSGLSAASSNGDGTISAGIYSGINVTNDEQLTMNPGLYCFDGNFTINGNNDSFVIGEGVTIYMRSGNLSTNGNATVRLSAPNFVDEDNDGVTGVLVYLGPDNEGEVDLTGNSESYYSGTIFGENEASRIEVGGTGDMSSGCFAGIPCFGTQLIAGTVKVHGNAIINITFNDEFVYALPARLTLER